MNSIRLIAGVLLFALSARADFQGSTHLMPFDEETIGYGKTQGAGPVDRLQEALSKGEKTLKYEPGFGYLRSVLQEQLESALLLP